MVVKSRMSDIEDDYEEYIEDDENENPYEDDMDEEDDY